MYIIKFYFLLWISDINLDQPKESSIVEGKFSSPRTLSSISLPFLKSSPRILFRRKISNSWKKNRPHLPSQSSQNRSTALLGMLQKLLLASTPQGGSELWGLFTYTVPCLLAVIGSLTLAMFSFVCLPWEHNCIHLPFLSSPFITAHHQEPEPQMMSQVWSRFVNIHQEKRKILSMKRCDPMHSWKCASFPPPDPRHTLYSSQFCLIYPLIYVES